eukprot:TRINITY_DN6391_c0_g1_i1.p1 TRINITY_DN6391_c0_g1~~TRINITY_DN6391_c0_g1_i1.p1  ORF type:complete len:680 (+),score=148.65 TRINITY_DN6391_c0_g1_i1:99-2138(+)
MSKRKLENGNTDVLKPSKNRGRSFVPNKVFNSTRSSRSGVILPIGRIQRRMKDRLQSNRISSEAACFMTAVLEYMAFELVEIADIQAQRQESPIILPQHIVGAILDDEEFVILIGDLYSPQHKKMEHLIPMVCNHRISKEGSRFSPSIKRERKVVSSPQIVEERTPDPNELSVMGGDILNIILFFIDAKELEESAQFVCKRWGRMLNSKSLFWRSRFFYRFVLNPKSILVVPDHVYFDVISPQSEKDDWRSLNEMVEILLRNHQGNFSLDRNFFERLALEVSMDYADVTFEPQAFDILQYETENYFGNKFSFNGKIADFANEEYEIHEIGEDEDPYGYRRGNTYMGVDSDFRWLFAIDRLHKNYSLWEHFVGPQAAKEWLSTYPSLISPLNSDSLDEPYEIEEEDAEEDPFEIYSDYESSDEESTDEDEWILNTSNTRDRKIRNKGLSSSYYIDYMSGYPNKISKEGYVLWDNSDSAFLDQLDMYEQQEMALTESKRKIEREWTRQNRGEFFEKVMGWPQQYDELPIHYYWSTIYECTSDPSGLFELLEDGDSVEPYFVIDDLMATLSPNELKKIGNTYSKNHGGYNLLHMMTDYMMTLYDKRHRTFSYLDLIVDKFQVPINSQTQSDGYTPLLIALFNEDVELAMYIRDKLGANTSIQSFDGKKSSDFDWTLRWGADF